MMQLFLLSVFNQVIIAAFPNLWSGIWVSKVVFWNTDGVFKCLPIFALCFACQTYVHQSFFSIKFIFIISIIIVVVVVVAIIIIIIIVIIIMHLLGAYI